MAGTLIANTINTDTAGAVFTTQNAMTGIAKAWANINGTPTASIRSSFNISSVTANGTGDWTISFTTAMPDANYCIALGTTANYAVQWGIINANVTSGSATESAPTASSFRIMTVVPGSARFDAKYIYVAVFSS